MHKSTRERDRGGVNVKPVNPLHTVQCTLYTVCLYPNIQCSNEAPYTVLCTLERVMIVKEAVSHD